VKCNVDGAEAELAAKLVQHRVSLRQYKQSLMEEELLPTRIRYKASLEMLLSVECIVGIVGVRVFDISKIVVGGYFFQRRKKKKVR